MKRLLVKVGGAILEDAAACASFAASVARARVEDDARIVVVHGGGAQLTKLQERLGLTVERDARGLRITDDDSALAALQVFCGEVNTRLVAELSRAGLRALGMTGADSGLLTATPIDPALGHVGEIADVNAPLLDELTGLGFVPVIATMVPARSAAPGAPLLNVNADAAAGPVASAWGADAVLMLSDVEAVRGADGPLPTIDRAQARDLEAAGVLAGGMIPKVSAALDVADARPCALVKIASGLVPDPVGSALHSASGTLVFAGEVDG